MTSINHDISTRPGFKHEDIRSLTSISIFIIECRMCGAKLWPISVIGCSSWGHIWISNYHCSYQHQFIYISLFNCTIWIYLIRDLLKRQYKFVYTTGQSNTLEMICQPLEETNYLFLSLDGNGIQYVRPLGRLAFVCQWCWEERWIRFFFLNGRSHLRLEHCACCPCFVLFSWL